MGPSPLPGRQEGRIASTTLVTDSSRGYAAVVRKWVGLGIAVVILAGAAVAWALSSPPVAAIQTQDPGPTGLGRGQPRHAATVAAAFDIDVERALALHDAGVGWGAMVKLLGIAEVKGVAVDQLLAGLPKVDGEYQFDFGAMEADLTPAQRAELADMPRGLGHLKHLDWLPPGLAKKLESPDSP